MHLKETNLIHKKRHFNVEETQTSDNQILKEVESAKYLGVHINNNLKWDTHIQQTVNKANKTLGFLRRNLYGCPPKLKETAYLSLVRSVLEYAAQVWDPYEDKYILKLDIFL